MPPILERLLRLFRVGRHTTACDVIGVNFEMFHEPFNRHIPVDDGTVSWPILAFRAGHRYARLVARGLFAVRDSLVPPKITGDGVIIYLTRNQYASLEAIASEQPSITRITLCEDLPGARFPTTLALIAGLFFVVPAAITILRRQSNSAHRRLMVRHFEDVLNTYGTFFVMLWLLAEAKPRWLLIANDHSMATRAAQQAGKALGIPTVYVPHASITTHFPPLDFDYALLDGIDSATKYDQQGGNPSVRVLLVGNPKTDRVLSSRLATIAPNPVTRIGVCVNVLDPASEVVRFVENLRETGSGIAITLRPHPGDTRDWAAMMPDTPISNATLESSLDYLKRVDVVIAGLSNIHLEARLCGAAAIFVDFPGSGKQPYDSFVTDGICVPAHDAATALGLIADREALLDSKAGLQRYVDTLGTSYAGRATELASSILRTIECGREPDAAWRPLPGFNHLEVLSLRN